VHCRLLLHREVADTVVIASLVLSAVMTIDGLGAAAQEPIGYVPPVEYEARHYQQDAVA
jgi:hypothetical protein